MSPCAFTLKKKHRRLENLGNPRPIPLVSETIQVTQSADI